VLPEIRVAPPGPKSRAMVARLSAVECPAFDARRDVRREASGAEQTPIVLERGSGPNVFDVDGNRYVDLAAGFGALALGHAPERIEKAVLAQRARLGLALGDVYASDVKVELCERLAHLYPEPGARVMLGLSGADAVTAAMKTALLATGRAGVVAFEGGYHGLSHGPLALCGLGEGFRAPFEEHIARDHVGFVAYPACEDDLEACLDQVRARLKERHAGAVVVEPVLGRGGCVVPPRGFLPALRRACDDAGALLVADEVWTGLGRAGAMLVSVEDGVVPDLVCLGKSLGAGLPISACIGSARTMNAWGTHGGSAIHTATHFGAPPSCAAALALLDALEADALPARALALGERWRATLAGELGARAREVRGRGLMVGVDLDGDAGYALAVTRRVLALGYIVLTGGRDSRALTLSPPLNVPEPLLNAFAGALTSALRRLD
jgi:4-aminobutyrate aminotransferase/(S)-3-amino-2-methylpropionate transaminase